MAFSEEDKELFFLGALSGLLGGDFFDPECLLEDVDPEVIEGFLEEFGEN